MDRSELKKTVFCLTEKEKDSLRRYRQKVLPDRNAEGEDRVSLRMSKRSEEDWAALITYYNKEIAGSGGWQRPERKPDSHASEAQQYTADQFMSPLDRLVIYRQDRFERVAAHKHDYIELCYVWSGSCEQEIEGKRITTRQGDVCIFDTQAVHSVGACGENDIIVNILMKKDFFDEAFFSRMTKQGIVSEFLVDAVTKSRQKKHYLYFPSHKNQHVNDIMESLMMEHYTQDIGMREVMESYVIILFTELLRTWRDASKEKDSVSKEVQVLELLSYIEEHFEDCRLPEMGKAFGMHGNYLTALLKEKTGRSFVEHVQEQKLKKAKSLLENTDLSIAELIPLCGYNNLNFFYKKFREAENCTPAEYRKAYRDGAGNDF